LPDRVGLADVILARGHAHLLRQPVADVADVRQRVDRVQERLHDVGTELRSAAGDVLQCLSGNVRPRQRLVALLLLLLARRQQCLRRQCGLIGWSR
jgi:hypothetical protein